MTVFALDERLTLETIPVGDGPLSRILLLDDSRFAWVMLVPRRTGLHDWVDLSAGEITLLDGEIRAVTAALRAFAPFDKLNVGSLGNMVRQLHVHVVARKTGDAAWPGPVWGVPGRIPYAQSDAARMLGLLRHEFGLSS
jgi:diadenosine tetraphosphate (Ap4A) HIT family hydrolase